MAYTNLGNTNYTQSICGSLEVVLKLFFFILYFKIQSYECWYFIILALKAASWLVINFMFPRWFKYTEAPFRPLISRVEKMYPVQETSYLCPTRLPSKR